MDAGIQSELYLKSNVNNGSLSPKQELMLDAAMAAIFGLVVLLVVSLVFVHPRGIRAHHSFPIDDYVKDEVLIHITDALSNILVLRDVYDTQRTGTYSLSITSSGKIMSVKTSDRDTPSCQAELYDIVRRTVPSIDSVTVEDVNTYTANVLLKEVINMSAPAKSTVSRFLLDAASSLNTVCETVTSTYMGLVFSLAEDDIANVQRDKMNVGTIEKFRAYVTKFGVVNDDASLAHLGSCIDDEENGASRHAGVAKTMSKALCGFTDVSNVIQNTVPQLNSMYKARSAKNIIEVFWVFYQPYFHTWTDSITNFGLDIRGLLKTPIIHNVTNGLQSHIDRVERYVFKTESFLDKDSVGVLSRAADDALHGRESSVFLGEDGKLHTREGFLGKLGDALKAFALLPQLLADLITYLPKIFKSLITILVVIAKYLPKTIEALVQATLLIAKDPVEFMTRVIVVCLGVPYLVCINLLQGIIPIVVTYVYAWFVSLPTLLLHTAIAAFIFVPCVIAAILDHFMVGLLRLMARTENHPEAWWYNTGFEHDNMNVRTLLSFSTCAVGYNPKVGMCFRKSGCLSSACPAAMIMQAYRTGKYRHAASTLSGQPLLPNSSNGCKYTVERGRYHCDQALYGGKRSINYHKLRCGAIKDMVRALCIARVHVLPGKPFEQTTLARHALHNDPLSPMVSGVVTDCIEAASGSQKNSTRLIKSIVTVAVICLGVSNMEKMQGLLGSYVATR